MAGALAPRDYSFWDYERVLQHANGDEKFLMGLVQDLTDQTRTELASIDTLLQTLQGGHVSTDALSEMCARTQQLKGIYELLCCPNLLAASSAMHTYAKEAATNHGGPGSSEICETLCRMRNALAAAADVMLRELTPDEAGVDQLIQGVDQQMPPEKKDHPVEFPFLNYPAVVEACGGDEGFVLQLLKELPASTRSELDMIDGYIEEIKQEVRWELSDGSSDSGSTGNTERNNTQQTLRNILETIHKLKGAFQTLFCTDMHHVCMHFHEAVKKTIKDGPKEVSEVYAELLMHRGLLQKACEVMFEHLRRYPLESE